MDYFYDGQIRRYVTQFMRIFIGFKTETGDGTQSTVPVMYGDLTKQVANIIRENSENKLPTVPRMACYITGLELDNTRLSDASFVSKLSVRERDYSFNEQGDPVYSGSQGGAYTVERLMPTPFTLSMKCDIWTSNTDQKLQLLEQILVLFNPSLEVQTTDNYIDWTSLSAIYLNNISFTSRSIPAGTEQDIDVCSVDFTMPIYITSPAKVKKLGIVQTIIANIFTEQGDVQDIENLAFNQGEAKAQEIIPAIDYGVLLLKSNNGQPYDYNVTLLDRTDVTQSLNQLGIELKVGDDVDWETILNVQSGYTPGAQIYFKQPTGFEMVGTFAINPADPNTLVVTFDQDTIPTNTLIDSNISGVDARGTIDAIVDPFSFNPIERFGGVDNIPLGTRYLMLETIGDPSNSDGPDGWKGPDGSTQSSYVLRENDIVEWNGTAWRSVFDSASTVTVTYVTNLRTGIQYKWENGQWLKSFEGEYSPGFWRFDMNPL